MAKIAAAVGPDCKNNRSDVKTVQILLNQNINLLPSVEKLDEDGLFGNLTSGRIELYQKRVVKLKKPDRIVSPNGPTLRALATHGRKPIPTKKPRTTKAEFRQPAKNPQASKASVAGLPHEYFVNIAQTLKCEAAAVKAVVATELGIGTPFYKPGVPTILFERHKFSKWSNHKFDQSHPDLSGPWDPKKYGKKSEQYGKLDKAKKLDRIAALKACSWGAFQIMGENHQQAGFGSVDKFVNAMKSSVDEQAKAFVNFVKNSKVLLKALRLKQWATFALKYNGTEYKTNQYDIKMAQNYKKFVES